MDKKIVLLLSAILVFAFACGGAEALIPSIDSYIKKEGMEIPDESTDTQLYFGENSEKVLSMTPASDADMLTEKEVVSLLDTRGFSAYPITHFFPRGDWMIVGQIIIYGYLFVTQKELLGRIDKEFALIAVGSVKLRVGGMIYPFKWINYLNFLLQLCVIFKFLDPILEKIGQGHRKKRLEALEAKKRGETVDIPKNDVKEMFAFLKE